jgi:hypothetical protein
VSEGQTDRPCERGFGVAYARGFPPDSHRTPAVRRARIWQRGTQSSPAYASGNRDWDLSMPIRLLAERVHLNASC